jgi:hypothetical protein
VGALPKYSQTGETLFELTGMPQPDEALTYEELCACLEMIQLMENVFLDLRLDDYWSIPTTAVGR